MTSGERAPLPHLVVALETLPPDGLERPLNLGPRDLAALVTVTGEEPPAFVTDLAGVLRLRRLGSRLEVRGAFQVGVTLACDRCLAEAEAALTGEIEECLTLDEDLAVTEGRVDLSGLLAESFWLAWPYRFFCRPDCAGLCLVCGADLNLGPCTCKS